MGGSATRGGAGEALMVGKRPRPPMKRTTSMMGLSSDLDNHHHHPRPSDRDGGLFHPPRERQRLEAQTPPSEGVMGHGDVGIGCDGRRLQKPRRTSSSPEGEGGHGYVSGPVSPEIFPVVTASFLRACGLCKRSLGPGKDTFMYGGEIAFCSLECRQQQMTLDERKEKCSFASMKNNPSQATARSKPSSGCETAAA